MVKQLLSPKGTVITGTKERLIGQALIGTVRGIGDNGIVDFDYSGGTEVDWNSQETYRNRNPITKMICRVFIDDDGEEWFEDQLIFREPEDD